MDFLLESIIDFIRVAALLTIIYFVYQYRDMLFRMKEEEEEPRCRHSTRLSRSRSRSCSRSRSKTRASYPLTDKNGRRGRRPTRRCPDCSLCNIEQ
ncbi:uncharacterized protein LOC119839351 isoform X2 [Zerene cesonia]|uniref:uncharacterized protein LOC119839351 isoform X2 n=1 Tax=Zerene cesonia TaxID=33412 RepID=UPI0018E514A0|nr:uncharacterized protein LOC119839351 isoform X2 [Zerene cesonia]